MNNYLEMIKEERHRQISVEGWTPNHDDEHTDGSLGDAAACYAAIDNIYRTDKMNKNKFELVWPWEIQWFKKEKMNRKRQLIVAGALILAELERLERLEMRQQTLTYGTVLKRHKERREHVARTCDQCVFSEIHNHHVGGYWLMCTCVEAKKDREVMQDAENCEFFKKED